MSGEDNAYPAALPSSAAQLAEAAAHHRAGRFHQAEVIYRRILAADPKNAEAWHLLGLIAHQAGHHETGVSYICRALELTPGNATFLNNLGTLHAEAGDHTQAEACLRESIRHAGGYSPAHNNLGEVLKARGFVREAIDCYRAALQSQPDFQQAESNYLMALNYDPGLTGVQVAREHCRLGQRRQQQAPPPRPLANDSNPERRLRLGYLSPDFRKHAVARFFEPILSHHDRSQFDIFLYAEVAAPDSVSEHFRALATGWRRTNRLSAAAVAELIRADGIDILIDLAGHTRNNRLDVMLLQPAPVQITYLGYPNTTGLDCVGYRIVDDVTDPPGITSVSSEQLLRLPGSFVCFQPPASAPAITPPPLSATGRITFGSHHPILKLNASVCQLWSRVLAAVPGSRLLLFRHDFSIELANELRARLTAAGMNSDRIEIRRPSEANDAYLDQYRDIDIILDCFPFTGHTMTCESLWMGVPVVTLRGDRPASRLTASVLTQLDLTDLIADSPEQYLSIASQLASNAKRLTSLRQELRPLMANRLCDAPAFTRRLEDCYRGLWRAQAPRELAPTPRTSREIHERGETLVEKLDFEAAIQCFQESIRLDPKHTLAYNSLGNALKRVGRLDAAIEVFRRGLDLEPLQPTLHNNLAEVYQIQCRFPEAMTSFRLATLNVPPFNFAQHNYLAAATYVPSWSADQLFDERRLWGLRAAPIRPRCKPDDPRPDRPLRVGYVSADFHEHPVARFIEPVLRHHDPVRFVVHLYAEVARPDEVTQRIKNLVPFWRDIRGRVADDVARQVREDQIDILVDLTGHYADSRLDVLAEAPAPVQVSYLGDPNTTGLPNMDYRLSDEVLHPPGEPTRMVERVVRLPGRFFCFEPPATAPLPVPPPCHRKGYITFGSHHNLQKLHDGVLSLWARLLREEPESRLLLLRSSFTPPIANWLRERFAALGIHPDRIEVYAPPSVDALYLSVYHEIDIILDAFPFSGHTTTCEALWMGVPVVTLRGDRTCGRLSAAVLSPLGLADLIADSPDEYVTTARRLANDPVRLTDLRQNLRSRMATTFEAASFTRRLEEAYRQMWRETITGASTETEPASQLCPMVKRKATVTLRSNRTIEIIVPVRPGGRDRFPVSGESQRVQTRVLECADGNLSRLYRDTYLHSQADLVVFKHDDFCFRDWDSFESQVWGLVERHPIVGVAGTRVFSPHRLPWWRQTASPNRTDGFNRGMVSHPGAQELQTESGYEPTFFGPPGPVTVLDGAMITVLRRWEGKQLFGRFTSEQIADWWDPDFGRHFYDMAFTLRASLAFDDAGLGPCCYAMVADVTHESGGGIDRAWEESARRFVARYGHARPLRAS